MQVGDGQFEEEDRATAALNLARYKEATLFQSSVITFLARLKTDQAELAMLRRFFTSADSNMDGFLTTEELESALQDYTTKHQSLFGPNFSWKQILKTVDIDKDGKISYEEFFTAAADRKKLLTKQHLKEAFDVLDINKDGKIVAEELKACFAKGTMGDLKSSGVEVGDKFFERIIRSIDIHNEGFVTFEEFEMHMMKMVEPLNVSPSAALL